MLHDVRFIRIDKRHSEANAMQPRNLNYYVSEDGKEWHQVRSVDYDFHKSMWRKWNEINPCNPPHTTALTVKCLFVHKDNATEENCKA